MLALIAGARSLAALSFVFASPLIAAVILIEAAAIGGALAAARTAPRSARRRDRHADLALGMGSFTGLSSRGLRAGTAAAAPLRPSRHRPVRLDDWTGDRGGRGGQTDHPRWDGDVPCGRATDRDPAAARRPDQKFAIAFHGATGKSVDEVLFSGQEALPGLLRHAGTWSLRVLALLIVFKGLAYMLSLGSFRGGPVFPALFLAAAGGIMASRLPGFGSTPAVAVGMGAAIAAVLRLPLAAIGARHPAHRQRRVGRRAAHHRRRRRFLPGHLAGSPRQRLPRPRPEMGRRRTDADAGGRRRRA